MSVIQARKERDRAAREELILDHAQEMLLRDGFQNLNLDELAEAVEYSKGTLYLHFKTKEDIALAIANRACKHRADLFERALQLQGLSRERLRAIGFAACHFANVYPDYFNVELMLKSHSFWEKLDEVRKDQLAIQGARCFHALHKVVIEGLQAGDIRKTAIPSEQIVFAIASTAMGSHIMARSTHAAILAGIEDPLKQICQNVDLVTDGLDWKPLSTEYDYAAVDGRIKKEIFPDATWFKN